MIEYIVDVDIRFYWPLDYLCTEGNNTQNVINTYVCEF